MVMILSVGKVILVNSLDVDWLSSMHFFLDWDSLYSTILCTYFCVRCTGWLWFGGWLAGAQEEM